MSLRELFSKNNKKRAWSSSESEPSHSFVNDVKIRISGLVTAKISNWFGSMKSSSGIGSTVADSTDSSDDEPEIPPPKRKCYIPKDSDGTSFQVKPVQPLQTLPEIPKNQNVLYTSIQPPTGGNTSTYMSYADDRPPDSVMADTSEKGDTSKSPHSNTTSGVSVANKRKSIFQNSPMAKRAKKSTTSSPTTSLLSDVHPKFRPSMYSSPFYQGPTRYGGASASTYIDQPIIKHQKVRESHKTPNSELSSSSRKILDLLENCPSLLADARRIPVFESRSLDRSTNLKSSAPCVTPPKSYMMQELSLPSIASIVRLKERHRLMNTTKAVRQIIATHSSTQTSPSLPITPEKERFMDNESPFKLKTRVTRINRGSDPNELPESVQLPTAVLQIDKDNLPKFSYTLDTCSVRSGSPNPTEHASNCQTSVMNATYTAPKIFINMPHVQSDGDTFAFPDPAVSPVPMSHESQIIYETSSGINLGVPKATDEASLLSKTYTKTAEPIISSSFTLSSKDWRCSDCWVDNKADLDKCVACGGKRPAAATKSASSVSTSSTATAMEVQLKDWTCDNCWIKNKNNVKKCAACGDSKPVGKESTPSEASPHAKPTEDSWKCSNCWIKNKNSVKKCAACGDSKPGGKELTPASHAKPIEEDWKCQHCWVKNNSSTQLCCACGRPNKDGKEQTPPAPQPEFHSPFARPPSSNLAEIIQAQKRQWECSSCLIRNEPDRSTCQCCDMEREGPSKEITSKPFTFPKESNINFKFGIDPKEQEKNIAKKAEQEAKERRETNNNNSNIFEFPPVARAEDKTSVEIKSIDKNKKNDDDKFGDKGDSVVPEVPKVSFMFEIPSLAPAKPTTTTAPVDKPKLTQDTSQVTFGAGFLSPSTSEQTVPSTTFPSFTVNPNIVANTQRQQKTVASTSASLSTKNVPMEDIKDSNTAPSFTNVSTDKSSPFSLHGKACGGAGSFGALSPASTTAFSFGVSVQSTPTTTTPSFFSSAQPNDAATKSLATMFGSTEQTPVPGRLTQSAAPLFTQKSDAPSAPTTFSFGATNNNENKGSSFGSGFKIGNTSTSFKLGTANTQSSGAIGSMASTMSGFNDPRNVPSTSRFNAGAQESTWGAKGDAFEMPGGTARDQQPFGYGTLGNQFSSTSAGSVAKAPMIFGGQAATSEQNMFEMQINAGGGMFGNTAQPASMFAAQPARPVFGSSAPAQPPAFGAPSQSQPSVFGAPSQPPAFGVPTQSQPPAFGAPAQAQPLAFGAPAQSQPPAFGPPVQSQPPAFGTAAQRQPPAFGASASNQPAAFGSPSQSQPASFGAAQSQPASFGAAQSQPASFGAAQSQPASFGAAQSQPASFGAAQSQPASFGAAQSQPASFGAAQSQPAAFGTSAQSQPAAFGASAQSQPAAFGAPAQPSSAASTFTFGAGVFNFGQVHQQVQQQQHQSAVYSFGSNTMPTMNPGMPSMPPMPGMTSAMSPQPMDRNRSGGVQFTMGSAPAAGGNVRRMRKAVRRNQPR